MVDVLDSSAGKAQDLEMPFFVVSPMKLGVMTFFTVGFYWLYCFYQSWRLHRGRTGENVSPFWRSFFGIFFIYPLLRRVDEHIRLSGKSCAWSVLSLTLGYYGICLLGLVVSVVLVDQLWPSYVVGFIFQLVWVAWMMSVQKGINLAAGDVAGESNGHFTASNWVWILICTAIRVAQLFALIELSSLM